jgi:sugar lactone lactonase YvrE
LDQRVEIVAGNGSFTTSGDGGPALEAGFISPFGVLPDEVGGFWISDVDGHTIRNVDADGIVRRVAGTGTRGYSGDGGLAVDAQLDGPTRMALDMAGNLIFCDTGNHVLRRSRGDGTIETFAGLGVPTYSGDGGPASMAGLSSPYDLAVTAGGSIYVADSRNNVVRVIQPDGTISTVVGSGISGFAGDRGPANEARLRQPSGLAFAPDGSLWIADTLNHRVRRVAEVAPRSRSN